MAHTIMTKRAGNTFPSLLSAGINRLANDPLLQLEGRVIAVNGLSVQISDRLGILEIGSHVQILPRNAKQNVADSIQDTGLAEIVGVEQGVATALPFGGNDGIHQGARVLFLKERKTLCPTADWLGRVVNGLGRPIDGLGELPQGNHPIDLKNRPPMAAQRARLGDRIDLGVKALNCFTPARAGQRLGIFSGSGVGKSSLLGMVARHTDCDVRIIALIGERSREVREFIEDELGEEGLAKSIVIVSTADEPALMRREAAFMALALAEHFRDQGLQVLCMMDSLTRIAMAQREIGLAAGEPPTSRGYTPSVFSMLPTLLERAGPGLMVDPEQAEQKSGAITGLFTVLVEGDDHEEPITDHVRAILDGHIVLDRGIAERGRFPAINILKSLSRNATAIMSSQEQQSYFEARQMVSLYDTMADMIAMGAYQAGTNPTLDRAIDFCVNLEEFLTQKREDHIGVDEARDHLTKIVLEAQGAA